MTVSDIRPRFNHHVCGEWAHRSIYVSLRIDGTCSIGTMGRAGQTTVGKYFKVEYEGSATATCTVTSVTG